MSLDYKSKLKSIRNYKSRNGLVIDLAVCILVRENGSSVLAFYTPEYGNGKGSAEAREVVLKLRPYLAPGEKVYFKIIKLEVDPKKLKIPSQYIYRPAEGQSWKVYYCNLDLSNYGGLVVSKTLSRSKSVYSKLAGYTRTKVSSRLVCTLPDKVSKNAVEDRLSAKLLLACGGKVLSEGRKIRTDSGDDVVIDRKVAIGNDIFVLEESISWI